MAEGERKDCVEKRLLRACGEATLVVVTVARWVTHTIETDIRDRTT